MDTRLLEDVLLLLEERNFSAAAARRNMTQPAFSRRIRVLEQWIGRDLLVRRSNRVEFSSTLEECEPQIRAMLAHLQQLRSQLRNPETGSDPLVIATQHSLSVSVVPEILAKAREGNPALRTRLRTQNRDIAMSMFLRREADLLLSYEIRDMPDAPFDDSVARYVWRRDALIPVVGGELKYRLAAGNILPKHANVIAYPADSQIGQIIENYQQMQPLSLNGPRIVESAFSVAVAGLVLSGSGAAWVPHSLIYDDLLSGDVAILHQDYGRIPLNIMLYVHRSNAKADKFQKYLFT